MIKSDPINEALKDVGLVKEATGNNDGVPARKYMRGDELSWCAGAVLTWYTLSDFASIHRDVREYYRYRNVMTMLDGMKERGYYYKPDSFVPMRNDVIFFSRTGGSGGHVGLVESCNGVRVYTVEGNVSNRVAYKDYPVDSTRIIGYARPWLRVEGV